MCDHNLLLKRQIEQSSVLCWHEGRIAVKTSDTGRCSGRLEIQCKDGDKLSVTFALYGCDRGAIGWVVASIKFIGDGLRDLMLNSVEKCLIKRQQR